MTIGVIGAGKAGTTLGAYLSKHKIAVSGYYSRTYEHAASAADFTGTKVYHDVKELIAVSDTLFLTTPDGEIGHVWDCITKYELTDKIICHFSGSLSSQVFSGIEKTGASGCSIHPMFAFSDKYQSYKTFSGVCLTMEGQDKALQIMRPLFEELGHRVFTVKAENKAKYHAAAALASNCMIGLFQSSLHLLEACGFSEEDSRILLEPLVRNNVEAMLAHPAAEVLTGPVERNDVETVQKHLEVLQGQNAELVYRSIGRELLGIAEKKNPDRDYTALKQLL